MLYFCAEKALRIFARRGIPVTLELNELVNIGWIKHARYCPKEKLRMIITHTIGTMLRELSANAKHRMRCCERVEALYVGVVAAPQNYWPELFREDSVAARFAKRHYAGGETMTAIAKDVGVSNSYVSQMIRIFRKDLKERLCLIKSLREAQL